MIKLSSRKHLNNAGSTTLAGNVPQVTNQSTPIVLDIVGCRGEELHLSQCESSSTVELCSHSDDAGAFCNTTNGIINIIPLGL